MKIRPKKSLGQNFLIDQNILNIIADLGEITKDDEILEVGPGTGNLSEKILKKNPKKLHLIEKDKKLAFFLSDKFKKKVNIINDDILKFPIINITNKPIIIFGNLPYNISTQILINWIRLKNLEKYSKKFILMFQKEVADRIIAKDNTKNYGRLSILCSWKMNIKKIIDINPSSFYPRPKIKSTLLVFEPKESYYHLNDTKNLEHITNVFFNQRRKMIKKPLKILFKNFNDISESLSLDLNLRPHNLSALTYYKICSNFEKLL